MKRIFLAAALLLSLSTYSQTIVKDAQGNYKAVSANKDTTSDVNTSKTFTDAKGNIWPVYNTKSGRVYALRTSKNGNTYKQYLDKKKD